jgi:hypothetical protein
MSSRRLQLAIDPSLYEPIGRFIVNFGGLEAQLDFFSWTLLTPNQRLAQIAFAGLPFSVKVQKFGALFKEHVKDAAIVARMDSLRIAMEEMNEERNRLIHAGWGAGVEPGKSSRFRMTASARRGYVLESVVLGAADISTLADRCLALAGEVMDLLINNVMGIPRPQD